MTLRARWLAGRTGSTLLSSESMPQHGLNRVCSRIVPGFAPDLHRIGTGFAPGLYRIGPGFAPGLHRVFPGFAGGPSWLETCINPVYELGINTV